MPIRIASFPAFIADGATREGKFLQVQRAETAWLLFATADECRYHNQLLGRFLVAQGLPHRWLEGIRLEIDDPALTVPGGGRFRYVADGRILSVWDASSLYGRFDGPRLALQLQQAGPPWSGMTLQILD